MQQLLSPEPPSDVGLERALLALVLADNAVLDRFTRLEPEHFYDAVNREVFTTARDLRRDGRPVNLVTLTGLMGGDPLGGTASILDAIKAFSLAGELPDATSVEESLIALYVRRRMQAAGEALAGSVQSYATKPAEVIETITRELEDLRALSLPPRRTLWDAEAGIDAMLRAMESDDGTRRVPTGLRDLDARIGGLRPGELGYLGGRPSMGKSALAACIGANASKAGHGTLVISLEMSKDAWLARLASRAAFSTERPIPYSRALNGDLTQSEREAFARAALTLSGLPMWIEERSGLSALQIIATIRKVKPQFERMGTPLALVIVDHIGKVAATNRYKGNRTYELGEISNELAHLAKSEDVAVLALAQLNRDVDGRENKRPTMPDLRESGRLEEDADTVLFAYREAYYLERQKHPEGSAEEVLRLDQLAQHRNELEVGIGKHRRAAAGTVTLWCDIGSNVICDRDWRVTT
jgi:replicative DNA helicase